jgi:hypothetical protein
MQLSSGSSVLWEEFVNPYLFEIQTEVTIRVRIKKVYCKNKGAGV